MTAHMLHQLRRRRGSPPAFVRDEDSLPWAAGKRGEEEAAVVREKKNAEECRLHVAMVWILKRI